MIGAGEVPVNRKMRRRTLVSIPTETASYGFRGAACCGKQTFCAPRE